MKKDSVQGSYSNLHGIIELESERAGSEATDSRAHTV